MKIWLSFIAGANAAGVAHGLVAGWPAWVVAFNTAVSVGLLWLACAQRGAERGAQA